MIFDEFIFNLMTQHVVPFWIAVGTLFFIVMEILFIRIVKREARKSGWIEYTVNKKIKAFSLTAIVLIGIYVLGILLNLIFLAIIPILITIGIVGVVALFFYSNYLLAKKYGKHYDFKKGDKLKVIDVTGLGKSALVKTPKDSIVTCLERIQGKDAYRLKTKSGKIAERKEWRLKSAQ